MFAHTLFSILHYELTFAVPFYLVALYTYYHGIIDHSGINFKAQWWQPWQPDAEFHDQHHQFFHCNFGFNMTFWDKVVMFANFNKTTLIPIVSSV